MDPMGELLKKWGFGEETIEHFAREGIDLATALSLSSRHIDALFTKIGDRSRFDNNLSLYKEEQKMASSSYNNLSSLLRSAIGDQDQGDFFDLDNQSPLIDLEPLDGVTERQSYNLPQEQPTIQPNNLRASPLPLLELLDSPAGSSTPKTRRGNQVVTLCEATPQGRAILKACQRASQAGPLETKLRNQLCTYLITQLTPADDNVKLPENHHLLQLSQDIARLCDSESAALYYCPSITRGKFTPRKNTSGWLVNARNNRRKALVSLGFLEPPAKRSRSCSTDTGSPALQSEPANIVAIDLSHLKAGEVELVQSAIDQLKGNIVGVPWPTIENLWSETVKARLYTCYHETGKVQEYLNIYPVLKGSEGWRLLIKDFKALYPAAADGLATCKELLPNIISHAQKKIKGLKDKFVVETVKKITEQCMLNDDDDVNIIGAVILLSCLYKISPAASRKGGTGSRPEVLKSLVSFVPSENDVTGAIQEHALATEGSFQPFFIAVDMYLFGDPLNRQTFRGSFIISLGEDEEFGDPETRGNGTREGFLQTALTDLYRTSELRSCFVAADVLALDNTEEGMRVHVEMSFEPIFTAVTTGEVRGVLARELAAPAHLRNVTALPDTLHVEENSVISMELKEAETTIEDAPTTEAVSAEVVEELRECAPITLALCSHLPYNTTAYPNLVGHPNKDAMIADVVAFRELLDAECSHLAQDFVCEMLQPRCDRDHLVRPCRAYCRAFHAGCGARLPDRLRPHFDCSRFPDYFGPGSCTPEADCSGGLQRLALSRRACDGMPDCAGAEDERGCAHCAATAAGDDALRCALHARCLPPHLRCDGTPDCPDGSDETGCLWIARSLASWRRENGETTLGAVRSRSGYAVWAERGRDGKICAAPYEHDKRALTSVATSLCRALTFRSAISAEVVPDSEEEVDWEQPQTEKLGKEKPEYVEVVDPFAPEISFQKSECPQRKVIRVTCDNLECGLASARGPNARKGVEGLSRSAQPGDWPWHAALLRSHVHACDAALIHPSWLITTASCFQGQPKAEWTARLGTVRIQSTTPWQQEQRIIGMVKSPVEGSMLALVRLEEPVEMTDFVRPLCLPEESTADTDNSVCNTLGWTRNRDQLQRVHVTVSPMNTCENVSIATVNGICAEPLYDQDDCDEEEYAGSSMMCFNDKTKHWSLVGVSGWRIACSKIGLGRPRIYDAIASHVDWIRRTISNSAR